MSLAHPPAWKKTKYNAVSCVVLHVRILPDYQLASGLEKLLNVAEGLEYVLGGMQHIAGHNNIVGTLSEALVAWVILKV